MRIKEILLESNQQILSDQYVGTHEGYQKLADYLKSHCQPWLAQTDGGINYVYRGANNIGVSKGNAVIQAVRTDRKPRDSTQSAHRNFNAVIAAAGGTANRSNSMFVTGSAKSASQYGIEYIVIPLGNFHYTWSPIWGDWTNDVDYTILFDYVKSDLRPVVMPGEVLPNPNSYDPAKVAAAIKVDEGLDVAIDSGKEIMIQCASAIYMIPETYINYIRPILIRS